jgi:hypothetical protein
MTGVLRKVLQIWMVVLLSPSSVRAVELPQAPLAALQSLRFKERERAQEELLKWGRERPEQAKEDFFIQAQSADDPEVRERCQEILRELVLDEYAKEGEGFVGIAMRDDQKLLPGDPLVRSVIFVTLVQDGSPAHRAGIQVNDMIVGLNGQVWHNVEASPAFREEILGKKPGTTVKIQIVRNEVTLDVEVTLGRKPSFEGQNPFFNFGSELAESMEQAAKEAYFRRWLSQRKAAN